MGQSCICSIAQSRLGASDKWFWGMLGRIFQACPFALAPHGRREIQDPTDDRGLGSIALDFRDLGGHRDSRRSDPGARAPFRSCFEVLHRCHSRPGCFLSLMASTKASCQGAAFLAMVKPGTLVVGYRTGRGNLDWPVHRSQQPCSRCF